MIISSNVLGRGAIAQSLRHVASDYPGTLFNCAGIPHPSLMSDENIKREWSHIESIKNLAPYFDRIVHVSTPAVLGNFIEDYDESVEYGNGVTLYGYHKRKIEKSLCHSAKNNILIVRLFSFVSVQLKKQIVYDAIRKLKLGVRDFHISKEQKRCFVCEEDFISMMRFSLNNEFSGIVNFTNSEATHLINAVEYIAQGLNFHMKLKFHPNDDNLNYMSLASTKSRLFDRGYTVKYVGLCALDEVIRYYENNHI
ncbi:hypothetical protein [Roseobacter sp. HKCCD5988]|uniref:hypothetical protein n=1 Tax=Roseobacter sp. HKCCD5988 TaxID=3120338 RepID=UPI0030EB5D8F